MLGYQPIHGLQILSILNNNTLLKCDQIRPTISKRWLLYIVTCQAHPVLVKRVQCTARDNIIFSLLNNGDMLDLVKI